MKRIIISFCLAFMMLIFIAGISASNTEVENPLGGFRGFNIAQAPWEYCKGTVVSEENDIKGFMETYEGNMPLNENR